MVLIVNKFSDVKVLILKYKVPFKVHVFKKGFLNIFTKNLTVSSKKIFFLLR